MKLDKILIMVIVIVTLLSSVKAYDTPFLRGSHIIYLKNLYGENFEIKITKKDFNMYEGADFLNITLVYPNGEIIRDSIEDDGIAIKGKRGKLQVKKSRLKVLKEFMY